MARIFIPATGDCLLIDDLDFTKADQTVRFTLDGIAYELALSIDNVQKLRAVLDPFLRVSHVVARDDIRSSAAISEGEPVDSAIAERSNLSEELSIPDCK